MTTQQLIYATAVPVSGGRHAKASVEVGADYGFTRHINSVPLMAVEFAMASAEYAVVFAITGNDCLPVIILGARKNENLFIDAAGAWRARYVPAFVRRYPFVFSTQDEGKNFTLCVDEAFPGLNFMGRGQALFDAGGKPTGYVDNVLKFLQEYRLQFARTQTFCATLKQLGLLEPMQAQFTTAGSEKMSLTGFMVVNRNKLKALGDEQLAALARTDELELIYLHLASMRNFNELKDRLVQSQPPLPAAPTASPVPEQPVTVQ
jgi:hypothetical protein